MHRGHDANVGHAALNRTGCTGGQTCTVAQMHIKYILTVWPTQGTPTECRTGENRTGETATEIALTTNKKIKVRQKEMQKKEAGLRAYL